MPKQLKGPKPTYIYACVRAFSEEHTRVSQLLTLSSLKRAKLEILRTMHPIAKTSEIHKRSGSFLGNHGVSTYSNTNDNAELPLLLLE